MLMNYEKSVALIDFSQTCCNHCFGGVWNFLCIHGYSSVDIRGLCCQKQVSQAGISKYIPQFNVGCNYLSLPEIPASGSKVLILLLIWHKTMFSRNSVINSYLFSFLKEDDTFAVLIFISKTLLHISNVIVQLPNVFILHLFKTGSTIVDPADHITLCLLLFSKMSFLI